YLEITDHQRIVAVEAVDARKALEAARHRRQRAECQPHADVVARGKCRYAADVIGMLVRDEDRADRTWLDADPREARRAVAHTESAVDHHARSARLDDEAIALAARADGREAHQRPPRAGGAGMRGARGDGRRTSARIEQGAVWRACSEVDYLSWSFSNPRILSPTSV